MANLFKLLPVMFSCLLLAAHFLRREQDVLVIVLLALPLLLLYRKSWVPKLFQFVLMAGAVEWLYTAWSFAQVRMQFGQSWTRMALIIGAVALFTGLSALVFRARSLRDRYAAKSS